MALPTATSGQEVTSDLFNRVPNLLNGSTGGGQPVKLYDYTDAAAYSLVVGNQDTTNGLIAAFQYGVVEAATTVIRIRKQGMDGVLLDSGGLFFSLDAKAADGITLRAAQSDSAGIAALEASSAQLTANDTAWNAAIAAALAQGSSEIRLGPGVYIMPNPSVVTLIDNLVIRGAGMGATILKHRASGATGAAPGYSTNLAPFECSGRTNVTFADLTIDGNRTNVNGSSSTVGFIGVELSLAGTHCSAFGVKVTNFNGKAVDLAGTNNGFYDGWIDGPALSSYNAWSGGGANDHNWGGAYGIICTASATSTGAVVSRTLVTGCRNNGIAIGGYGAIIANCVGYGNHRDVSPTGSGGGQMGFQSTTVGGQAAGPRYCTAVGNYIGTTIGTYASGLELNTGHSLTVGGFDVVATGNVIYGQPQNGISVDDSVGAVIHGNTTRGNTVSGIAFGMGTGCLDCIIDGNVIADTANGGNGFISAAGKGTVRYSITTNKFINNGAGGTTHFTDGAAHSSRTVFGNTVDAGTTPPNYLPAGGLTIAAGNVAVTTGSLTVSAGGITVTAGGLVVTAGGVTTDTATINGTGTVLTFSGTSQTQTTIGAAGAASALPGVPRGYFKIVVGATACAVPYWIAS